ncbi:MAG: hypothetical protein K2G94_00380, partial [Muribaculaceae bacterium]|nr:hypothetical protein [Muribaculaceae bacterium]
MKKLLLALMCAAAGFAASAATFTYTHTFAKGDVAADAAAYELSGVKWQTTAMEYVGFDTQNSKGLQIGSSGKPSTAWTISTDAFSGVTVTKVVVEGATASGGNATIDLKVGGAAFGNSAEIARDLSACTFTGSAKGDLAVNFTNGAEKAMYIKSITVTYEGNSQIGEGGSGETPVDPDPVETVGKGTAESPYTVADVFALGNPATKAWVKGYIVGSAAGKSADSFSAATGEEASATNVFIAASASETDYTKCLPVQLPAGAVREALNLQANPGNLGKEVTLYGSLEKYFGQSGVKTVTEYTIDGGGNTPVDPDPVETVGKGTAESPYTVADVVLLNNPATKAWVKGYIVGSAAGKSADSFSAATGEEASATNVFIAASASETDYTKCLPVQLPAGAVREALNLQANPGNLGKEVTLYGSLEKYFGQSGVKTVTEYTIDGGGNTPVDPDPVETVGKGTEESPYTVADVVLLNNPATKAWVKGYIVGSAAGKSADSFTTATGEEASGTNVFIAATATESDYTKCLPVQLPAGEVREALNLQANPGNLGKSVTIYGSLEKYFGQNGVKTVTAYSIEGAVAPSYPEVADIASFLDEQPESFTSITSPVTVVYQNGLDLFVQDETGSMLVYGNLNDRTFKNGDQLTGLTGKFNVYHGMVQCAPVVSSFPEAVAGSPVEPAEVTLADVTVANLAKYVTISGLTANAETTGEGESARTVITVTDGTTSV